MRVLEIATAADIRNAVEDGRLYRVVIEEVDENGLTAEDRQELDLAITEANQGIGLSKTFDDIPSFLADLHERVEVLEVPPRLNRKGVGTSETLLAGRGHAG